MFFVKIIEILLKSTSLFVKNMHMQLTELVLVVWTAVRSVSQRHVRPKNTLLSLSTPT